MYSRTILINVKVLHEHKDALRALAALEGGCVFIIKMGAISILIFVYNDWTWVRSRS
jgi:hypothetical protein